MTQWIDLIINLSSLWFWLIYGAINSLVIIIAGISGVEGFKEDLRKYNEEGYYRGRMQIPVLGGYLASAAIGGTVIGFFVAAIVIWLFPIVATATVIGIVATVPIVWYVRKELPESEIAKNINKYLTRNQNS